MLTYRRLLAAGALVALAQTMTPAAAQETVTTVGNTVTIYESPGGNIDMFEARYAGMARQGYRFVIAGGCYSACTMAIGLPAGQVCATPQGVFGFHSAYTMDMLGRHHYSGPATQQMAKHWSPAVQKWLRAHGGLTPNIKTAPATLFVPAC